MSANPYLDGHTFHLARWLQDIGAQGLRKGTGETIKAAADEVRRIITAHHDAWVVETFGVHLSGLSSARVEQLVAEGYLNPDLLEGQLDPAVLYVGEGYQIDPWAMSILMGARVAEASDPKEIYAMRRWSLERWAREVDGMVKSRLESVPGGTETGEEVRTTADFGPPAPPSDTPPSGGGAPPSGGDVPIPAPPDYLTPQEREAWIQARTRAGEYARGLGNVARDDAVPTVVEAWDGEDIVVEADLEQRLAVREAIREEVANAIAEGLDEEKLARVLANRTGDYARNWLRIARTELQAAHNDGVVITAVRAEGPGARIARVPEPGACEDCRRLFLDADGKPRIFTAEELVANGTNVGRKRENWVASIFPIHPHCSCDVLSISAGLTFNDRWALVKET